MTVHENRSSVPSQPQTMASGEQSQGVEGTDGKGNQKITIEFSGTEATDLIGYEKTEEEQESQESKAPDGGYGWVVVLGCFISHVLVGSLERVDGIFFLEFRKRFGHGAQLTAWPIAIVSALRLCFGPIAGLVCNRYSVRSACVVGAILIFAGLLLDSCAPNFYFLFLSHGLIQGVGRGLVYGPGLFLVGMYFDKRRGFATGLSSSGVGVGTFALVPLYQLFFDTYGYQGAFMLIGSVILNVYVCAMMYRPLSLHFKFSKRKQAKHMGEAFTQESLVLGNAHHTNEQNANAMTSNNEKMNGTIETPVRRKKEGCFKSSFNICFPVETFSHGKSAKKKLFHFYLLKNPSFLLCCISIMFFTAAFKSAFVFIPAQIKSLGNSESEAALALSISGVLDTIGRILVGFIFDLKCVRSHRLSLYTVFIFAMALVSFILPRVEEYSSICVVCGAYGFVTGGFVSQKSVVIVDILESVSISNSFGIFILFQGVGMIIGPPISGALKDTTGTFHIAFDFGGALMVSAGCLMMLSSILFCRQSRRKKMEQ